MNDPQGDAGSRIGDNAILNTSCSVDHDCEIGPHAHVAPGSTLAGSVTVGEEAFVGAGAVVIADVPAGKVVVGIPARVLRDVAADELLEAQ